MMGEEHEPAIPGGLGEDGDNNPENKNKTWKISKVKQRQVMQSIVLYIGFFTVGMEFSVIGPTLLDLEHLTQSDTKSVSLIFTFSSVAGIVGAILAGVLIPRFHHWLILALPMLAGGTLFTVVPYIRSLPVLCTVFAVNGALFGLYNAGGNMVLLRVWGTENGSWMQALHCIYGVGALVGPLVAEPFLQARHALPTEQPSLNNNSILVYQDKTSPSIMMSNFSTTVDKLDRESNDHESHSPSNMTESPPELYQTNITWAFLIIGLSVIGAGLLILAVVFCCSEIKLTCIKKHKDKKEEDTKDSKDENRSKTLTILLIILVFIFYLNYCILEQNYGNYLTVYAVKDLGWSEREGAQVTSGYWGMFMAGRGLGIFLVRVISPPKLILGDVTLSVLSLGILMWLAHHHAAVLWVCSLTLGFGISTIFATGITWAEIYINVSGGVGAIFLIAGAGGGMVGPLLIGVLFDKVGPEVFTYVMFTDACLLVLLYISMLLVARKLGKRQLDHQDENEVELEGQKLTKD